MTAAPAVERLPIVHQSLGEVEFSWAGETVRHIGTVVHGVAGAVRAAG